MQPLISFFMMVSKVAWWLMEWVCRRFWALYQPNMKFLYYPHVDPVEVAMALNPSRLPHWGRFVTFSMWLQPRFIPCLYGLYGRWLKATLQEEGEPTLYLDRPSRTRGVGRVASICPCAEVESSPSPRCVTEKFGLHVTPSAPATVQDGAHNGLEHRSTMGRRSGGNATVLVSEPWRGVPVDGDRHVVEIRVGPPHQTQDGC